MFFICYKKDDILHHQIKGAKWGQRRFQNPDGSLTPEGRKRYGVGKARKKDEKKTSKNEVTKPNKKIFSRKADNMTDTELKERTARLQLEKNFYEAEDGIKRIRPEPVSKGKKIWEWTKKRGERFIDEAVLPAAIDAGKYKMKGIFAKELGLSESEINKLLGIKDEKKEKK